MNKTNGLTQENLLKIIDDKEKEIKEKENQIKAMQEQLDWYENQIKLQQKALYGRSSEKSGNEEQLSLFDEAEVSASVIKVEPELEEVIIKKKTKKKAKKRMDVSKLPVTRKVYEVEGDCPTCGNVLRKIGENIRKELIYKPARYEVIEHVQEVCTCSFCEQTADKSVMIKAEAPKAILPKCIASSSLLASIMNDKYNKSLPLYRQEVSYKEAGLQLTRQTMSNWMIKLYDEYFHEIVNYMKEELLKMEYIGADETTVQVLKEAGKSVSSKSYMWVYKSGRSEAKQLVIYQYEQSRAHIHAIDYLKGYKGILQSDGYQAYDKVDCRKQMGCWAHARRKFHDALATVPKGSNPKETYSYVFYHLINQLFKIEREIEDKKDYEAIYKIRKEQAKPIVEEYFEKIAEIKKYAVKKSLLQKAIDYSDHQKEKLMAYLDDGRIEISNNATERAIKPFTIGRKNWLFCNSVAGANSSAAVYSLIESAKANGLVPERYVEYLLEQCPYLDFNDKEALEKVVPWSKRLPETLKLDEKS